MRGPERPVGAGRERTSFLLLCRVWRALANQRSSNSVVSLSGSLGLFGPSVWLAARCCAAAMLRVTALLSLDINMSSGAIEICLGVSPVRLSSGENVPVAYALRLRAYISMLEENATAGGAALVRCFFFFGFLNCDY